MQDIHGSFIRDSMFGAFALAFAAGLLYQGYLFASGLRKRFGARAPSASLGLYDRWYGLRFLFSSAHRQAGDLSFSALTWIYRLAVIILFAVWAGAFAYALLAYLGGWSGGAS